MHSQSRALPITPMCGPERMERERTTMAENMMKAAVFVEPEHVAVRDGARSMEPGGFVRGVAKGRNS